MKTKDWYKVGGTWHHFTGLYLDGELLSPEMAFLLGNLFYRRSRWDADIRINGKNKHIGYFGTQEEATRACAGAG